MFPLVPSFLLVLLLAAPALLTPSTSQELEVRGQRTPRDTKEDSIKVVITEGCATQGDSSSGSQGGKEIDLSPGSPLVLTHKIKLVPSSSGSGSGPCGCEKDFAALRERLERLEREVSALREKCGGAEGGCCTSKESKGAGCSIKPEIDECPNECSDQGRCVEGKCVCFPGFSGPDCGESNCPGNCNDKGSGFAGADCSEKSCPGNCNNRGRCINGQCVCKPAFTGPDCSKRACPDNCNNRGRCVDGKCVCESGFTGDDCSEMSCPGNCNNRGRCVNGQCVCNDGFTGDDCSEMSCPGNCNNRGRCVNGQCVCNDGFTGDDCSEMSCPGNCNNRGRCVNGQCVCNDGFTGDDCSEKSCPGNCNNRGRCVNGQCVCNDGFTGDDCSEKACPNNCNNHGKCVNGVCVCDLGFAGSDCTTKSCPNSCSNKGRCIKGRCVCRRGFTGPDCSQCEEGKTGPNCDTVMSGVSQLSTRDIAETSVTLVWTPPPVQYDSYHITFTSQVLHVLHELRSTFNVCNAAQLAKPPTPMPVVWVSDQDPPGCLHSPPGLGTPRDPGMCCWGEGLYLIPLQAFDELKPGT
ncbi:Tenascin [Nibea albiflora]|nr:Tenascin [Nibea albiflora]